MRIVRGAEKQRNRGAEKGGAILFFSLCNNQHHLLIWERIAAVLISVVIGIYWQARPSEKTLEQIETLISRENMKSVNR